MDEQESEVMSETENYLIWRSPEENEYIYHLELGGVSLHLAPDEWEELLLLFKSA